jgi:uncharacterized protein (UPF0332 family)
MLMQIEKAQESLRAAELCYQEKLYNSAANRAYYAMFQAAMVGLLQSGVRPRSGEWTHEQLRGTFAVELTHHRKIYPSRFVTYLADAWHLRNQADYTEKIVSTRQA